MVFPRFLPRAPICVQHWGDDNTGPLAPKAVLGVGTLSRNGGSGITPENFGNFICQTVHFGEFLCDNWYTEEWVHFAL